MSFKRRVASIAAAFAAAALVGPAAVSAECTLPNANSGFAAENTVDFDGPNFTASQAESFVQIPFTVPAGTTAIRIRYCYDNPLPAGPSNTLDIGVFEPKPAGQAYWDMGQRRGWSGSARRDIVIAVNGFSSTAAYEAEGNDGDRNVSDTQTTTRAYKPGPIPAGQWAAELGLAAIGGPPDPDGVDWDMQVQTTTSPDWADQPYAPNPYSPNVARPNSGWYEGDFHVHGEQEPGNASTRETLDHAFIAQGIDFVTLVDHNNDVARGELGRYQGNYPGKLVIPGVEVTTYDGHFNNQNQQVFIDYRTGPIYELDDAANVLVQRRGLVPPAPTLAQASTSGGFGQINHPTTFPESIYGPLCRGCAWDYTAPETGFGKVDAIEVHNGIPEFGPAPNPFTETAIGFYEDALATGAHIAAVGSTDAHDASETSSTQAAVGRVITAVYAPSLSPGAITQAVKADRTYVKVFGADGPDLRVTGTCTGGASRLLGGTVKGPSALFRMRVFGAGPGATRPGTYEVRILRNGTEEVAAAEVTRDAFKFSHTVTKGGRYTIEIARLTTPEKIEVYSSPIWFKRTKRCDRFRVVEYTPRPSTGSGVLRVRIPGAGGVRLTGRGVRQVVSNPEGARTLDLPVRLGNAEAARLADRGRLRVPVRVTWDPQFAGPRALKRKVTLISRRR